MIRAYSGELRRVRLAAASTRGLHRRIRGFKWASVALQCWASFGSALGLWSLSASADIIFLLGNNPQPNEDNILFSAPESGHTITGFTQAGIGVEFSSTQNLCQFAKGQADIEACDGSQLTNIGIIAPGYTFGDFILDLNFGSGTAMVTVVDDVLAVFNYQLGPGQNFLTILAVNNESISSISVKLSPGGGFNDVKQPRISGPYTPTIIPPQSLPEPGSIALLGIGLLALAARRRARKTSP